MQAVIALLSWLEATRASEFIRESEWAFPAIESVHVIALTLVIGTIAVVDLRLLEMASNNRAYAELAREVLPWTWGAFVLAAMSGTLLFISQPLAYFSNWAFRTKFVVLFLAGLNMLVFQLITGRNVSHWNRDAAVPRAAKIAATLSLVFWIAVVFFGRRIGFTMMPL